MPDVLGFADFAFDRERTYHLVRSRLRADCLFVDFAQFPLPKGNGAGVRSVGVLNPLDELAMRTYVGRCSHAIANGTYEERVLNGLIRRPGPGWFSADFRTQIRRRRDLQRRLYEHIQTSAVGFFDVKDFFRSCRHDQLHALLLDVGAPAGAARVLVGMLGGMFPSGVGLPVGFEGSAPLANLFLGPLDRALLEARTEFVRWTDDIDVFLTDASDWPRVFELVVRALTLVGLSLNPDKTMMLEKGAAAESKLLDPGRDSLFDDDAVANIRAKLGLETWLREFDLVEDLPPAEPPWVWWRLRSLVSNPGWGGLLVSVEG